MAGQRGYTWARPNPTGQVKWIGCWEDEGLFDGIRGGTENRDDFGQSVLFTRDAGDEATAANFTARLEPSIGANQGLPRRRGGFVGQKIAKHHPIAPQQ